MKIHEYQGKAVLRKFGVKVPDGEPAFTPEEAVSIGNRLGYPCVVKAQIHAGGRGKGGGVKLAKNRDECQGPRREDARHDPGHAPDRPRGPRGQARADRAGMLPIGAGDVPRHGLDRESQRPVFMASSAGGVDIEEVAAKNPEADPQGVHRTRRSASRPSRRASSPSGSACRTRRWAQAVQLMTGRCTTPSRRPTPRSPRSTRSCSPRDGAALRARRQDQLRRQRALPPPGSARRSATSTRRSRSRSRPRKHSASTTSSSTATSAAW